MALSSIKRILFLEQIFFILSNVCGELNMFVTITANVLLLIFFCKDFKFG